MANSAAAVVEDVLRGLDIDADTMEWLCRGVHDDDGRALPKEEMVDFIVPMIEEACGGEAAAYERAESVWHRLTADNGESVATSGTRKLLGAPLSLGAGYPPPKPNGGAQQKQDDGVDDAGATPIALAKEQAKLETLRAKLAKETAATAAELQAELEAARERAARLRISSGAKSIGSVELGPFTIANPGGGADLIEDANLVLVPGHRYGLIGRNGKGKSTPASFRQNVLGSCTA